MMKYIFLKVPYHGNYFMTFMKKYQLLINTKLRKVPKVSYKTLHLVDNKQNVQLTLNDFDENTSAAIASYFPDNKSAPAFISLINKWWKIINAKTRYNSNFG